MGLFRAGGGVHHGGTKTRRESGGFVLRGLGLVVGSQGMALRVESGNATSSVAEGSPDLTACAMDVLDREWLVRALHLGDAVADPEPDTAERCGAREVAAPLLRGRELDLDVSRLDRTDDAEPELRLRLAHPPLPDPEAPHGRPL